MPGTKVIIAGCGVAGPVLGILLKLKGYDPIIYERLDAPTDMGLSLGYVATPSPPLLPGPTYTDHRVTCFWLAHTASKRTG